MSQGRCHFKARKGAVTAELSSNNAALRIKVLAEILRQIRSCARLDKSEGGGGKLVSDPLSRRHRPATNGG